MKQLQDTPNQPKKFLIKTAILLSLILGFPQSVSAEQLAGFKDRTTFKTVSSRIGQIPKECLSLSDTREDLLKNVKQGLEARNDRTCYFDLKYGRNNTSEYVHFAYSSDRRSLTVYAITVRQLPTGHFVVFKHKIDFMRGRYILQKVIS
jgi:hypothetical protein